MKPVSGYRENAHTADWELEAWAPNLAGLLEQAARGMYSLSGMKLRPGKRQVRRLTLGSADAESLLVRFLAELLWLEGVQGLGFDEFAIDLHEHVTVDGQVGGDEQALAGDQADENEQSAAGEQVGAEEGASVHQRYTLRAALHGSAIASLDKEIKAVTYHNLQVVKTATGLRVNVVFDV